MISNNNTLTPTVEETLWHLGEASWATQGYIIPSSTKSESQGSSSSNPPNKEEVVLLFIPGNPGCGHYYEPLLTSLWTKLDGNLTCIGVSHVGHSRHLLLEDGDAPSTNTKSDKKDMDMHPPLSLVQQIEHKVMVLDHLRKEYPKAKFILAGHSLGAYIAVQVLKHRPNHGVIKCINLFPTLQHIGNTPKGRTMKPLTTWGIRHIAASTVTLLRFSFTRLVSESFFKSVVKHLGAVHHPHGLDVTVDRLLHGSHIFHALTLAAYEFDELKDLDEETIDAHVEKMVFYFSRKDGWTPDEHIRHIQERFPKAEVIICPHDLPHAFVMGHEEKVAESMATWLTPHVSAVSV